MSKGDPEIRTAEAAHQGLARRIGLRHPPRLYRLSSYAAAALIAAVAAWSVVIREGKVSEFHAVVLCVCTVAVAVLGVLPGYLDYAFRIRQLRPVHPGVEAFLGTFADHLNETRSAILHVQEQSEQLASLAAGQRADEEIDEVVAALSLRIEELERRFEEVGADLEAALQDAGGPLEPPQGGFLGRALESSGTGPGAAIRRIMEASQPAKPAEDEGEDKKVKE